MEATITLFGQSYDIEIKSDKYSNNNRLALSAYEKGTGDTFGDITVNVPYAQLEEDEICIKTWSENEWVNQLLTLLPQHFKDTNRYVESGFVSAPIWKFTK